MCTYPRLQKSVVFFALLIILVTCGAFNCNVKNNSSLNSVICVYESPVINNDFSIDTVRNEYKVFEFRNGTVLRIPHIDFDIINDSVKNEKKQNKYFVYTDEINLGRIYYDDKSNKFNNQIVNTDSMLGTLRFVNQNIDTLTNLKPVKISSLENNDIVREYIYPKSEKFPETFRIELRYSINFNDIKFTLSEKLDRLNGQKLCSILIHAEGYNYAERNFQMPPRTYSIRMLKNTEPEFKTEQIYLQQFLSN